MPWNVTVTHCRQTHDTIPAIIQSRATIGGPAKRHSDEGILCNSRDFLRRKYVF